MSTFLGAHHNAGFGGGSDLPEHVETLEYIRKIAPHHERFMYNGCELVEPKSAHPIEDAQSRVAWYIFDTQAAASPKTFKSYTVPNNFSRHFETGWYDEQLKASQQSILEFQKTRKDVCVIVANGPSLNKSDLDLLGSADVIVSNFAVISDKLRSKATYFTVVNDLVASQGSTQFNQLPIPKLIPFWLASSINPGRNTVYVPATVIPEFGKSLDSGFSWRSTVSFFNMQMAYMLGYKKVVLIGFDHSYVQADQLKEGDAVDQKAEDPNHFDPRYFKGKVWQAADTKKMEQVYEIAWDAYRKAGREIVNATVGGALEVFPRTTLEKALGFAAPKADSNPAPAIHVARSQVPRLVVFDMTAMGDGTATGELKASLFNDWPQDRILQIARQGGSLCTVKKSSDSDYVTTPVSEAEAQQAIDAFGPDIVFYRPVPSVAVLHKFAMRMIDYLGVPIATCIMDDWPAELALSDPEQWHALKPDLENLLDRSSLRLSICDAMSDAYLGRYGQHFEAFANGIDPADWPAAKTHSSKRLKLRYAGGLAPNMNLDSVLRVARSVEVLAAEGCDIEFEINTQKWWFEQSKMLFDKFAHTTVTCSMFSKAAYQDWLKKADALLIAYNFDRQTLRYVRYSMANKMPECLASGAAVFAHGPAQTATIAYLKDSGAAQVVCEDDDAPVKAALRRLAESPEHRTELAEAGRALALEHHNIVGIRTELMRSLFEAANTKNTVSLNFLDVVADNLEGQEALFLASATTALLLNAQPTLRKLEHQWGLKSAVGHALDTLPRDHAASVKFKQVREFVSQAGRTPV